MRRVLPIVLIVLAGFGTFAAWTGLSTRSRPADISPALLHATYIGRVDSLDVALRALAAITPQADPALAHAAFRRARAAYKRIEYLVEFNDAFKPIALADSLFAVAAGHEVRIFAVGVGAAAENDPATMAATLVRELASRTGGIYGAAESPTELEAMLRTLAKSASPSRLLLHLLLDPAPASGTEIAGTVTVTGERGSATADWSFVAS